MDEPKQTRALSFGARAEQYQRTRPSYPTALLDTVLSPTWTDVADVGAGTGNFSVVPTHPSFQAAERVEVPWSETITKAD